jgi:hypothetical protein
MRKNRASMSTRVVRLTESGSHDLGLNMAAAERVALIEQLSVEGWVLTRREMPSYDRANMPVRLVPLKRPTRPARPS